MENSELIEYLLTQGYENLRELTDGTVVGTTDLLFTRAVFVGLNRWSWDKRFCFEDRFRALEELEKLQTQDDEPTGFIARRGS